MTRRLLLLTLLLFLAISAVACGNAATPVATVPAAPATAQPVDLSSLPVNLQASDVAALVDNPDVFILDVREQDEYDAGHIAAATLIPLGTIPQRLDEIPRDKTVIAVCRSGNRSSQATDFLRSQGFDNVHNMDGGMNAWGQAGYPIAQ